MKKFFTLLALATMAASWTTMSARWIVGERKSADQLKVGDTVVIEPASQERWAGWYLQAADDTHKGYGVMVSEGLGIGDAAIITLEQGPNDIRTDAPTVLLKLVGSDQYVDNHYWDWPGGGFHATPNIEKAAPFQLLTCAEPAPWYDPTAGDDFINWSNAPWVAKDDAAWDDKSVVLSVSPSETDFGYVSFSSDSQGWGGGDHIILSHWTHSCQFNFYEVKYEKEVRQDLEELINAYTSSAMDYAGGTDPGYYAQEAIDAYESLLEQAMVICYDGSATDEQVISIGQQLKAAREAMLTSSIPMSEGYYYIINDMEEAINQGVTEKAMYVNEDRNQIWWGPFKDGDISFVFYVSQYKDGENWLVQNLKTNQYFGPTDGYTKPFTPAVENTFYTKFVPYEGTGSWYMTTHNGSRFWGMGANGDPSASDDSNGPVYGYNGVEIRNKPHQKWTWRMRKITDQETIDKFMEYKEQADRTSELNNLVKEGSSLYAKLFNFTTDTSEGLIKVATGGADEEPTADNQVTFASIIKEGPEWADRYQFLIDESDTTYMKGRGYIQIDISQTPQSMVSFFYQRRGANQKYPNAGEWGELERPAQTTIYAANTLEGDGDWTVIGTLDMSELTDPIIASVNMGKEYKYLRYQVEANKSGGNFFTLGGFQVYKASIDEATSQYSTTEGLKDKADALAVKLDESKAIVAADNATEADIQALRQAIDAVSELYADTTDLANLISECEVLLSGVQVGDGMGQLSDEALATTLRQVIDVARETAFTSPIDVQVVKASTAAIKEAKEAFMAGLNTFEVGKWYFITNLDDERFGDDGAEDAFCSGSAIYLDKNTPNASITKWGLFDRASMSLNADNNPKAMWRFVPVEGTSYYAIQNMYNGYYLGDFAGNNINLPISETPVAYDVAYVGNAKFNLIPKTRSNKENLVLWPEGYEADVVCHVADNAAAWTFVEVVPEEQESIVLSDFAFNLIDVMAVPYNIRDIAEYNDDVHTYAVKKVTQEENGEGELITTIEFYEKNEFAAGEPCLIVLGDTAKASEFEDYDMVIPFPTEFVEDAHGHEFVSNGIVGGLHSFSAAEGTAISSGKNFFAVDAKGNAYGAQTGILDLSTYKRAIEDQETAYTLVIPGMAKMTAAADVDADGNINTADVVAVYAFIIQGEASGFTAKAADVNGDGDVNSADVVAIYTAIVGPDGAGSPIFKAQMLKN
ncbi:MAG: hypothetical protein IKG75_03370 [Bacteroidaceae bacterium]|nr:hypothetical protein [Bacteroidaceae bacterium]